MKKLMLLMSVLFFAQVKPDVPDNFVETYAGALETFLYKVVPGCAAVTVGVYGANEACKSFTKVNVNKLLKSSKKCSVDDVLMITKDYRFSLLAELNGPNSNEYKEVINEVMNNFYACKAKKEKSSLVSSRTISEQDHEDINKVYNSLNAMDPNFK